MSITAGTITQWITIPATGTGSVYFKNEGTSYVGIQVIKPVGTTTTSFLNLYHSNVSSAEFPGQTGDKNQPLTAPAASYLWAGPDPSFSGSLFTGSAPASQMYNVGNVGSKYLKFEIGTVTGGTFCVSFNRKT
jgi:hypothetical protein